MGKTPGASYQRHSLGEPVARRQAVAFMCATIATELDRNHPDARR